MSLYFIDSPLIFFAVVAAINLAVLLLARVIIGAGVGGNDIVIGVAGAFAIAVVSFATKDLQLGAFILFTLVAYGASVAMTREALSALVATAVILGVAVASAYFLVSPTTGVTRQEVGGVTNFVHTYQSYQFPVKSRHNSY